MRLDEHQTQALRKALKGVEGKVYIFGSRVDNSKKGGDLDVLIFTESDAYDISQKVSTEYFMEREEKIDVTVMNPNQLTEEQEAFLSTISKEEFK